MKDLLNRHRACIVQHLGDFAKTRDVLVVVKRELAVVRLAFAFRVRIRALVRDERATCLGDHFHARILAVGDVPILSVEIGDGARRVFHAVAQFELAQLHGLKQVGEFGFTWGWCSHWSLLLPS